MIDRQECYVVLGHLMSANGTLGSESQLRVRKLLECVKDKKHQLIFFCGWDYRDDSDIKLAKALNDFFLYEFAYTNCSSGVPSEIPS